MLGQHESLSVSDAIKLNQMYNCPGSGYGVPGHLKVHIRDGIALGNRYSVYVQVTAIDSSGKRSTYITEIKRGETTWNQWIDFGPHKSWQYLEMSVWNYHHWSADTQATSNQIFTVSPGSHRNLQYCDGQSCTKKVNFDYNLDPGHKHSYCHEYYRMANLLAILPSLQ